MLAIPLGATCIEKHITHDRAKKGEDFESALNPAEFALLVKRVRETELALGKPFAEGLDESSELYRKNVRKRLVAARNITAGEQLTRADIAVKRSDEGDSPTRIDAYLGATAVAEIIMDTGLVWNLVRSEK